MTGVARLNRADDPAVDLGWQAQALCADDRDWHSLSQLDKKRICVNCPVWTDCLAYALRHATEDPEIWGGYDLQQRQRKAKQAAGHV